MATGRLLTTTAISYETRVPAITIKQWANRGWIECQIDSAGRRLFDESVIEKVRKIRSERWSRRPATA